MTIQYIHTHAHTHTYIHHTYLLVRGRLDRVLHNINSINTYTHTHTHTHTHMLVVIGEALRQSLHHPTIHLQKFCKVSASADCSSWILLLLLYRKLLYT